MHTFVHRRLLDLHFNPFLLVLPTPLHEVLCFRRHDFLRPGSSASLDFPGSAGTFLGLSVAGVRSVHRLQVCGIRTLLPATVLVWLIRHGLSIVGRAPIVFLPCIGSVPCPLRKGVPRRLAVGEAAAAPLSDGPVTGGHSAEHGDDHAGRHWRRGRGSRPLGAPDVSVRNVRRSDSGASAGFEGAECNLGNRERSKVSRGNKRRRSAERNFGS